MKSFTFLFLAVGLFGGLAPVQSSADNVATAPAGFVKVTVPASSDFWFGTPLINAPVFTGTVSSVSGNVITVTQTNGQPSWQTNSYAYNATSEPTPYYALIGSGAKEGFNAPIQANGANTLTVMLGADSLTTVSSGDTVKIVPCWTLATLFPNVPDGTEVLVFNGNTSGVNLSASPAYTFYAGYGWYDGGTPSNAALINPGESVVIRNNSTAPFDVVVTGNVPVNKQYAMISTLAANQDQDNAVSYSSPVPVAIGASGLNFNDQDELLVFDNTAAGYNKSASPALTYYAGYGWYDGGTPVNTTFMLQPGFGYVYRKAATSSPANVIWQSLQPYLPLQ